MNQRGQVYPLFAFLILVFVAFSALSVDVGYYRYQQRLQQTATDSAALAAAAQAATASPNAAAAAYTDASTNGYPTPAAAVSINPNYSDSYTTGSNGAVQVQITKNYHKFFGGYFSGGQQAITTTAVAALMPSNGTCLTSLGPTPSVTTLNGSKINGPQCGIINDGCSTVNGGTNITLQSFSVNQYATVGGVSCNSWSGGTSQFVNSAPIPDPCTSPSKLPHCYNVLTFLQNHYGSLNLTCDPTGSHGACSATCNNPATTYTNPSTGGCYAATSKQSFTGTIGPGVYVLTGNVTYTWDTVVSQSNGVTIIVADPNTQLVFKGSTAQQTTLSAPPSGLSITGLSQGEDGMLLFVPPNISNSYTFSDYLTLTGLVYMPGISVTFNGKAESFTGNFIAYSMTFNGGASLTLNPGSGSLGSSTYLPVLVE